MKIPTRHHVNVLHTDKGARCTYLGNQGVRCRLDILLGDALGVKTMCIGMNIAIDAGNYLDLHPTFWSVCDILLFASRAVQSRLSLRKP